MAYNYFPAYLYPQQIQSGAQNGSFISVRSVEEAYNYPVAPGNSITFRVENTPYVCTKTKGFSALDQPVFERYRLVKEEMPQNAPEKPKDVSNYDEQIKLLWDEINSLKRQIKEAEHESADADTVQAVHAKSERTSLADGNPSKYAE